MILPMIDVPVSLIGTFAMMAAMGFTLNNLTLFGLVLAIGIVVDDAIVVLENIERLIATGLDARTATIKAMERNHRADSGHHAGAQLGVHSVLLSRRRDGAVLPAIRRDDRRLDDHLGHQRHHHDAVAGRGDLQDGRSAPADITQERGACRGGSSGSSAGCLSDLAGPQVPRPDECRAYWRIPGR